ncbi:Spc19-domain-containing protein [Multifurca ochricompacta]|uniref:DASH complex subunit SPC19 n=1 Tax=Multifurca ochricompacta TaxID=376703 RepID=A0AAD4MBM7_9AGAM|nr:Spc19-domain-containing protein [Multifurca ochricompacta]
MSYYAPRQSRLSVRPRARDTLFPGGSEWHRADSQSSFSPDLLESVLAMEDCCEEAYEAQQILRNGTFDLPRMTRVLDNQRVFLLVDEGTVEKYKADLSEEIEPQITELISRAEKGLRALQKKQALLQTKVETAQLRPQSRPAPGGANRRLQMLVKQRERLETQLRELETEILTMEAAQKRR